MNNAMFEQAKKFLDSMSTEDIIEGLRKAGLQISKPRISADDSEMPEPEKMYKPELRLYAFVNFYLSSIQQGIQTGHAAVDIVRKYCIDYIDPDIEHRNTVMTGDWADNYKTFITLNGGNHAGIKKALELSAKSGLPFVAFHEDEASLGGLMTSVAVIVPDYIFNLRRVRFENNIHQMVTQYEWKEPTTGAKYVITEQDELFEFVDFLKSKDLAK